MQAVELNQSPTMCGGTKHEPETIHEAFVKFMEAHQNLMEKDILGILPIFFENEGECDL